MALFARRDDSLIHSLRRTFGRALTSSLVDRPAGWCEVAAVVTVAVVVVAVVVVGVRSAMVIV
jgi:hypothetical protein